jgi:rRNA-processing protein FCF1
VAPTAKAGKAAEGAADARPTKPAKRSAPAPPASAPADGGGKAVVFDTNALLLGLEAHAPLDDDLADLLGANRWVVPSTVLVELRTLAYKGKGAVARNAKLALAFAAKRCAAEATKLPGDDGLLEVARRLRAAVVTNDKTLQQECKRSGLTVIVLREDGRRLALLGAASGRF